MWALSAIVPDAEVGNWILMGEFRVIPRRDDYAKSFYYTFSKIVFFFFFYECSKFCHCFFLVYFYRFDLFKLFIYDYN